MAEFRTNSNYLYLQKTLENGQNSNYPSWVYYQDLQNTYPNLYTFASRVISNYDRLARRKESAEKLFAMADKELNKELSLLNNIFGKNISVDWKNLGEVKIFIQQFQELLRYKNIAERAEKRLIEGESSISIAPFFSTYFNIAFENFLQTKATNHFQNVVLNPQSFQSYVQQNLPIILDDALERMLKSKDFNNAAEKNQGYLEFFKDLQNSPLKDGFLKEMARIYNIEKVIEEASKVMKGNRGGRKLLQEGLREKTKRGTRRKAFVKVSFQKGGSVQEHLAALIMNTFAKMRLSNQDFNITLESRAVGEKEYRPDIITTINLDGVIEEIENIINSTQGTSRESSRIAARGIIEMLKKLDSGFIIYSNVKNYQLGNNFSGFSAGSNMILRQYFNLLSEIQDSKKLSQFVTAIMNTLSGAVGENQKASLEDLIAQDIAYFLYDDFETIAEEQSNGAKSLHIFLLSDFYVPLSFFLRLLGEAFANLQADISSYVDTTIYSGTIKYNEGPYGIEKWEDQRETALDEINIGIKFLRNFRSIMTEMLS